MTDVDIADFYAARLDEATEDAKYVHRWDCDAFDGGSLGDCNCGVPQMLLADIAAKRAIVETAISALKWSKRPEAEPLGHDHWHATGLVTALRLLAAPFEAHPDYDPAWRIDA